MQLAMNKVPVGSGKFGTHRLFNKLILYEQTKEKVESDEKEEVRANLKRYCEQTLMRCDELILVAHHLRSIFQRHSFVCE